jgi:PleD family two-component response regulator
MVLEQDRSISLEADTIILRCGAHDVAIEDSTAPIRNVQGKITGAVMVFHDFTAAQAMSMKMAHLAQHDFLTNLPNRILLNDRITQAILHAKRHGSILAVFFLA